MPWSDDYSTEIELDDGTGCISPVAGFSTYITHYGDLPLLTLEAVRLGKLKLSRAQVIDWVGKAEVERIEAHYVPEEWPQEVSV